MNNIKIFCLYHIEPVTGDCLLIKVFNSHQIKPFMGSAQLYTLLYFVLVIVLSKYLN